MLTCAEVLACASGMFMIRHYQVVADEIIRCIPGSEQVESCPTNRWVRIRFPDGSVGVVTDDSVTSD